jgi:hypothetical protein
MTKYEAQIVALLANAKPLSLPPSNETELAFSKLVQSADWNACKVWPDFAVFGKDDALRAVVEVKPPSGRRHARPEQLVILAGLASFGIPCFIWSPAEMIRVNRDRSIQSASMDDLIAILSK